MPKYYVLSIMSPLDTMIMGDAYEMVGPFDSVEEQRTKAVEIHTGADQREASDALCTVCNTAGSRPIVLTGSADASCCVCGADWPVDDDDNGYEGIAAIILATVGTDGLLTLTEFAAKGF